MGDKLVTWDNIWESQKELNGHVSMLVKVFKIGSAWDHGPRIRETVMGENMSICPMSLLFKDHKGWSPTLGTVPPTRPVVGGHLGINLHISELVSDILDPVVGRYEGGKEIISTEDMLARIEILNEATRGWKEDQYWGGMKTMEFRSCEDCSGEEGYIWSEDEPEVCHCEDGIDEDGRTRVTKGYMRKLRRVLWEEDHCWNGDDLDRKVYGDEVLPEDLQDQSAPMVLIGTDVVNLYPSLDISKVVEDVQKAVLETDIN